MNRQDSHSELIDTFLKCIGSLDIDPWRSASPEKLSVVKITGGLTNILYKVSLTAGLRTSNSPEILVRIYGAADGLLDREKENRILERLSESGISPRLIAKFAWGRFEEFLSTRSPLKSGVDMVRITPDCDMVALIAACLRQMHSVDLRLDHKSFSANVFEVTRRWLTLISSFGSDIIKPSSKCPQFETPAVPNLSEQAAFVKHICLNRIVCHPRVVSSPTCQRLLNQVLCHNDMLAGNLLFDESDKSLRLIDFEYSGYNYAVADIANVCAAVCESIMLSGEPQDVGKNFPSSQIQLHFVQKYFGDNYIIDPSEHEPILLLIRAFAMAEELRWTIWGILQSKQQVGDFDYCMYYNSRFNAYKEYRTIVEAQLEALV